MLFMDPDKIALSIASMFLGMAVERTYFTIDYILGAGHAEMLDLLQMISVTDSEYEYAVRYLDGEAYYKGKALVDEMYASLGEVMSSPLGMLAEALGMFGTGGGGSVSYGMAGNSVAGIQMGSSLELSNGIVIGVGVLAAAGEAGSIMESDGNARAEENRKKAEKAAKGDSDSYKKYDPKEIEKKYGLNKGEFHREVKPDILSDLMSKDSPYKDLMKKMGNNPDIYLSSDGQIEIVSTQFKGKSFVTDLNITDFLP